MLIISLLFGNRRKKTNPERNLEFEGKKKTNPERILEFEGKKKTNPERNLVQTYIMHLKPSALGWFYLSRKAEKV